MSDLELEFRLARNASGDAFLVQLAAGDRPAATAEFGFDRTSKQVLPVLNLLDENQASLEDLRDVGSSLWAGLVAGEVKVLFEEAMRSQGIGDCTQIRLHLPVELDDLPWEAVYYEGRGGAPFLGTRADHAITRSPPEDFEPPIVPPRQPGPVRILAVLPQGSGLDVEREWSRLSQTLMPLAGQVDIHQLRGRVTAPRVREELESSHWDIVHFAGHGDRAPNRGPLILLNDDGGDPAWVPADVFAGLFDGAAVRLVVLNCCDGAKLDPRRRSLSSLGAALLRYAPAVVAMRWEVGDEAAIEFSGQLYRHLFQAASEAGAEAHVGERAGTGRIDLALGRARRAMFDRITEDSPARMFVTPVLYLVPGHERLFELAAAPPAAPDTVVSQVVVPTAPPSIREEDLEQVAGLLRRACCLPVIGHRFLTAARTRGESDMLGPRELARSLATLAGYANDRDFEACEAAGDWMDSLVLQWVCERYLAQHEFYELGDAIAERYCRCHPPRALMQIAGWKAPATLYLYFDSLLEAAYGTRRVQKVNAVEQSLPRIEGVPFLINVRGSHTESKSLMLTGRDHEDLWERIGRISKRIPTLLKEPVAADDPRQRRSLFFLGVSPRDPIARRLAYRLLDDPRDVRRTFFACRPGEEDDPYWDRFPMTWLATDLEWLVDQLSARLATGGAGP